MRLGHEEVGATVIAMSATAAAGKLRRVHAAQTSKIGSSWLHHATNLFNRSQSWQYWLCTGSMDVGMIRSVGAVVIECPAKLQKGTKVGQRRQVSSFR